MKAILNHIDKENTITNTSKIAHPSYQTEQKPYKSTIKSFIFYLELATNLSLKMIKKKDTKKQL